MTKEFCYLQDSKLRYLLSKNVVCFSNPKIAVVLHDLYIFGHRVVLNIIETGKL